jgi:hypothetical protein
MMPSLLNESFTPEQRNFIMKNAFREPASLKFMLWSVLVFVLYVVAGVILFARTFYPEDVPQWFDNVGAFAVTMSLLIINLGGLIMFISLAALIGVQHAEDTEGPAGWKKANVHAKTLIPGRVTSVLDELRGWVFFGAVMFLFAGLIVAGWKWTAIWLMVVFCFNRLVSFGLYKWTASHIRKMTPEQLRGEEPLVLGSNGKVEWELPDKTPNTNS